jgi:hypothetical protein
MRVMTATAMSTHSDNDSDDSNNNDSTFAQHKELNLSLNRQCLGSGN